MLKISAVKTALATQLSSLVYPQLPVQPKPTDSVNPPCGVIMAGRPYGKYGVTLQGASGFMGAPGAGKTLSPTEVNLDVLVVVSHASTLERIIDELDLWLGFEEDGTAVSVAAAIAEDPTLGGVVEWCVPSTVDAPGPITWEGLELFGSRVHLSLSVS